MSRAHNAFVTVQNAYDNAWQAAREMENVAHKFECEADQMREERDALQTQVDGWREWASSSQCIYCSEVFHHDPINHEEADELKKAHILVCPKHPYGQVLALLRDMADGMDAATWGQRIQSFLQQGGSHG